MSSAFNVLHKTFYSRAQRCDIAQICKLLPAVNDKTYFDHRWCEIQLAQHYHEASRDKMRLERVIWFASHRGIVISEVGISSYESLTRFPADTNSPSVPIHC